MPRHVSPARPFRLLSALLFVFAAGLAAAEELPPGVRRIGPAELRIERDYVTPPVVDAPLPQGVVDLNPPWLHVVVPLPPTKDEAKAQHWDRRFYFRLSQDPSFQTGVIASGPKRWSFFYPHQTLARGRWYWSYGVADARTPAQPVWSDQVLSFVIDERAQATTLPPTADEALAAIKRQPAGAVAICAQEEVGKLLPTTTWPELAALLQQQAKTALARGEAPIRVEVSDQDHPPHLTNPKEVYFTLRMRAVFTAEERRVDALLRAYLLTGDERCRKLGVQRAIELEQRRLTTVSKILGRDIPLTRHAFYNTVPLLMLDAFWDDLPAEHRATFVALARELMDKRNAGFPHLHDQLEHAHFNQHDWQGDIKNLLIGTTIMCRHLPEMEEWFRYAYELWLYRNPALSRGDGGSMDGNGYLGVHDEQLVHSAWMLQRITGFNYFTHKRWFARFPTYMSYMNPVGNPGVPFSDGGDTSPGVHYLSEMLAWMDPGNPANVWRLHTQGRRDVADAASDLVKGYKMMDLLSLWRRQPPPTLGKAQPPHESAAAFPDVGLAALHSALTDPQRNLMVTFSAAPNGSFQHLHPAQNAFCLAYGGEPLFWRTGYYNGGQLHDAVSYKASRAHNTILVDGLMQGFDASAYGWIPRFVTGERISYVLGDASHAYNGAFPKYGVIPGQPIPPGFTKLGVPITAENGFGRPGVTHYRRHLALLRPRHVVVYDELEAEKPVRWSFLLHAVNPMTLVGDAGFVTANSKGSGFAQVFCPTPVAAQVTDQFFGVPVDEENKRGGKNPPHWHASITTKDQQQRTRFLALIEITPGGTSIPRPFTAVTDAEGKTRIDLDGYVVRAELDPEKGAFLGVTSTDCAVALVSGRAVREIVLGEQRRAAAFPGSTLLGERRGGRVEFSETVDRLPDVLLFGNRYH